MCVFVIYISLLSVCVCVCVCGLGIYVLEDLVCNIETHVSWYVDDVPENRPITWILDMIWTLATREVTGAPLPMPGLKSIQCQTGMCVFHKCATFEDGVKGQDCY